MKTIKQIQEENRKLEELSDKQLFLSFALMVSLALNWFILWLIIITQISFGIIFTIQTIISIFVLLWIRKIKD